MLAKFRKICELLFVCVTKPSLRSLTLASQPVRRLDQRVNVRNQRMLPLNIPPVKTGAVSSVVIRTRSLLVTVDRELELASNMKASPASSLTRSMTIPGPEGPGLRRARGSKRAISELDSRMQPYRHRHADHENQDGPKKVVNSSAIAVGCSSGKKCPQLAIVAPCTSSAKALSGDAMSRIDP
jgi:hypothetical protein